VPTGRCALSEGGNYAALASPDSADFTVIVHTFRHNTSKCIRNDPPTDWHVASSQLVHFDLTMLGMWLPTSLSAWRSCSGWVYPAETDGWLEQLPDVLVSAGKVTVEVLADCYYTLSTVGGVVKPALPTHIPYSSAFPLPYSEDFEGMLVGGEAPFFGDQMGKFETVAAGGGRVGNASRQQQPVGPWPIGNRGHSQPLSIIGDMFWRDVDVSSDILIEEHGVGACLALRVRNPATFFRGVSPGLYLYVFATPGIFPSVNPNDPGAGGPGGVAPTPNVQMANGTGWKLCSNSYCQGTPIALGELPTPWNVGDWHRLALGIANESAIAWLDGHQLFAGRPFTPTSMLQVDQPFNGSVPASGWAALVTTLGHVQFDNFRIDGKAVGGGAVSACAEGAPKAGTVVVVAPCDAPALRREWTRGRSGVLELVSSGGLCLGEAGGFAALVPCNSSEGLQLHDIKTGRISPALGTCLDLVEQGSHAGPPWLPAVVGQSCAPIATPAAWSQQFQYNPQTGALRPKSARCVADFLPWIPNNGFDGDQYRDCCLAVCL
jgi:hypothetical protein